MVQRIMTLWMWPWSMKMDAPVLEKCLAFCQGLDESNPKFTINVSLGKDVFKLDNKKLAKSSWIKKKPPSQIRREKKRREARDSPKEDTVKVSDKPILTNYKCSQCGVDFKSERGLKIHIGKAHKTESTSTQKETWTTPQKDLSLVIIHETSEETYAKNVSEIDEDLNSMPNKVLEESPLKYNSKCDLCNKEANSDRELKVHKAKCHTNVTPFYWNITTKLAFREKFSVECLIFWKQFDNIIHHLSTIIHHLIDCPSLGQCSISLTSHIWITSPWLFELCFPVQWKISVEIWKEF